MQLELHPLVPDALLPVTATARTRAEVPAGYGVQEQCLPFTAAAAAGLLIRAPFSFGWCRPDAVPAGARAFAPPRRDARLDAQAVFYVVDRPESSFAGNAFRLAPIAYRDPQGDTHTYTAVQPGLSFFDRDDLWIKRDDLVSPLYGGNKVRRFEYLLADAAEKGRRTIVTVGSLASTQVTATILFGKALGFEVAAIFFDQPITEFLRRAVALDAAAHPVLVYGGSYAATA